MIEIFHTRVFGTSRHGGNSCPVVVDADRLTDVEMHALARKFGLDTAFILHPLAKGADFRIRYFVPDHEMGVSGHATIAAVTVARLGKIVEADRIQVETISGIFSVEAILHDGGLQVTLEQNPPIFGSTVAPDRVSNALNIPASEIAASTPIQAVSVSRAKLLVPLKESRVLNRLSPNLKALWELCDELQVTGLYPFARPTEKDFDAEARQFPLRAGFPEDAATGVAAAALGAYLVRYDRASQDGHYEFRIAQGYAMGSPSLIEAIADCAGGRIVRTAIRGSALIVRHEQVKRTPRAR